MSPLRSGNPCYNPSMYLTLRLALTASILAGLSLGCVSVGHQSEVVPGMAASFAPLPRHAYPVDGPVTGSATVTVRRTLWQRFLSPLLGRSIVTGDHTHDTAFDVSTERSPRGTRRSVSAAAGSQLLVLLDQLASALASRVAEGEAVIRATEAVDFRALGVIPGADSLLEPRASVSVASLSSSFSPLSDAETASVVIAGKTIALREVERERAPSASSPRRLPLQTPKASQRAMFVELGAEPLRWVVTRRHPGDAVELDLVILDDESKTASDGTPVSAPRAEVRLQLAGETRALEVSAPVAVGADLGIGYMERYRFELPPGQHELTLSIDDNTRRVGARLNFVAVPSTGLDDPMPLSEQDAEGAAIASSEPAPLDEAKEVPAEEESSPFPYRFSAQVGAGGAFQVGGLTPLLPSGSLRLGVGRREGWASPFALALGFDFDHQSASTMSTASQSARWGAMASRLRGEAEWRALKTTLGPLPFDVGLLGGIGAVVGQHAVTLGSTTRATLLLGPTVRLGAEVGLGIGPGALVLRAPLDASWDLMTSPRRTFMPLAAGLSLGYRLDL